MMDRADAIWMAAVVIVIAVLAAAWLYGCEAQAQSGMIPADRVRMHTNVALSGTKDGSNVVFTSPFRIALDLGGSPMADLDFRGSRTLFSASCPPARGFWCLANSTTVNVNTDDAPQATDVLIWDWVGEEP